MVAPTTWTHKHLPETTAPKDPNNPPHLVSTSVVRPDGTVVWSETVKEPFVSKKDPRFVEIAVVCKGCNNGWMSRLQNQVKPILTQLMDGGWPPLTPTSS